NGPLVTRTGRSDRDDHPEDVIVAGRGLVPRDLGERVRIGSGPVLVVETASHASAVDPPGAGRAADRLVVRDDRAEEDNNAIRRAGSGWRVAVEDAATQGIPPFGASAPGPTRGHVAADNAVAEFEGRGEWTQGGRAAVEDAAAERVAPVGASAAGAGG